ncbi:unnamed protein product, partial [marine sediment metagenome]
ATPMALLVILIGWRLSFELMGLLTFVVCLVCWLVIRNRPEDLGLPSPAEIERRELGGISSFSSQNVAAIGFRKRLGMLLANKHIWPPFLVGLGSYGTLLVLQGAWGIPYIMQVYSMTRDSAANFMLLMLIGHAAGLVILGFVSDRLQRRKLPTIVAAFAYLSLWIILINYGGFTFGSQVILGNLLALIAGFAMGAYLIIGRQLKARIDILSYPTILYTCSAVILLVATVAFGYSFFDYSKTTYIMLVLLALVPQLIGHSSLNLAVRLMPVIFVSVAILGEPVGA